MTTGNPILSAPASLVTMCIAVFALVVLFGGILQQIGAPIIFISLLLMAFAVGLYLFSGLLTKTMRFQTFQTADKASLPFFNGMATASGIVSGSIFVIYAGYVYSNGTDFLVLFLGTLLGIGFLTLFFSAKVARSDTATLAGMLFPSGSNYWFPSFVIVIITVCSFLLLMGQIKLLSLFMTSFYQAAPIWGAVLIVIIAAISLVMGGMQTLSITRLLAFPIIALALIIPVVWVSLNIAGNPIPQLTFGESAVATTTELDREMLAAGLILPNETFNSVSDGKQLVGFNFFATLVTVAMGFAAMPHLLQHFTTLSKGRHARKSGIWTFVMVALLLTFLPAVAAFAKLEIYTAFLGIRISEMETDIAWIFGLSGAGQLPLIRICGQLVSNSQEVMAACGQAGNYFLSMGDVAVNTNYLMLSFGYLSNLPKLVTVILVTGALLAVFTTVDGLLLVVSNTVTNDLYHRMLKPKSPPGVRLFMNRFFLLLFAALLLVVAPYINLTANQLFAAAVSLVAASIFPALLCRIWIPKLTGFHIGISLIVAFVFTIAAICLNTYGLDFVQNSGDELSLKIPGLVERLHPMGFGLPGFLAFFATAVVTMGIEKSIQHVRERKKHSAAA